MSEEKTVTETKKTTEAKSMTFPNILAVVDHLSAEGWRIKKSTAYMHHSQGKIRQRDDGFFYLKDVHKYARIFLKRIETGQKVSATLELKQEKRLNAEIEKMEAQARLATIKANAAEGFFVERGEFERALAQRAATFKNDIETFIRAEAQAIIALTHGNPDTTPDLIAFMLDKSEAWLDRYAADKEFAAPVLSAAAILADDPNDDDNETADEIFMENIEKPIDEIAATGKTKILQSTEGAEK